MNDDDVVKGKSVSGCGAARDYWGEKSRENIGLSNFDEIRWVIVRDQKLAFEQFKKADLDYYNVNISREWVEELNSDKVQRGVIQKRKIFTDYPSNIQGIAFNFRREPFTDLRVRQAITLLLNRRQLIQQLFFNEYVPDEFVLSRAALYENPDNPKNER